MTNTEIWASIRKQLETAREELGYDHPETIALEEAEADADDLRRVNP